MTTEALNTELEQAEKLVALAKLKAEFSTKISELNEYSEVIEKLLNPALLLTPEECAMVTDKKFQKLVTAIAQAKSELNQLYSNEFSKGKNTLLLLTGITDDISAVESE